MLVWFLSLKVHAFAFGLVIIETLTGLPVLIPAVGHRDLLSMFEEDLDLRFQLRVGRIFITVTEGRATASLNYNERDERP